MALNLHQKKNKIYKKDHKILKSKNFVEGRYPNLFISSKIVSDIEPRAGQIKKKRFDRSYYQKTILAFIKRNGAVTRKDIDDLLMDKFAGILNEKQKKKKIDKLLYERRSRLSLLFLMKISIIILMFLLTFSNAAMGGEFGTTDGASIPE